MDEASARDHAENARGPAGVPDGFALEWIRRRYIEIASAPAQGQGAAPIADRLVWIARFSSDIAWWEIAVDDKTGRTVRVERSRSEARRG